MPQLYKNSEYSIALFESDNEGDLDLQIVNRYGAVQATIATIKPTGLLLHTGIPPSPALQAGIRLDANGAILLNHD